MKKKTLFISLLIITLIATTILPFDNLVNAKRENQNDKNSASDSTIEKPSKGLAKGKTKKNTIDNDPVTSEPTPPPAEPIIELDLYDDPLCLIKTEPIDWGEVCIGSEKQVKIYIKNNGEKEFIASLITESWYPIIAEEYITLSWDYYGQVILPGEVFPATLVLKVSPDCPDFDSFSFDIIVIGS